MDKLLRFGKFASEIFRGAIVIAVRNQRLFLPMPDFCIVLSMVYEGTRGAFTVENTLLGVQRCPIKNL
jgi:hypothetical protein